VNEETTTDLSGASIHVCEVHDWQCRDKIREMLTQKQDKANKGLEDGSTIITLA
jgi:hypothetical protein